MRNRGKTIDDCRWQKYRQFVFSTEREQAPQCGTATFEGADLTTRTTEYFLCCAFRIALNPEGFFLFWGYGMIQ